MFWSIDKTCVLKSRTRSFNHLEFLGGDPDMKKRFVAIFAMVLSLCALNAHAAVTEVKNGENVGIYTNNENVIFEVTRDNGNQEELTFKVVDIDGTLIKECKVNATKATQNFSLGYFKNGWYRVKIFTSGEEEDVFASFSVIEDNDGMYPDSPFAVMHLGRLVGSSKDAAYAEALKKLSVGTVRTDEIADINKSSRPYEKYNKNLIDAGISIMPTVSTNYVYPGTSNTGNIGGFAELLDVYAVHNTMAKAYNGKVPYWELINEPDINKSASADAFASWYKAAAIGISDAQPDAIKAFGGLCVTNSQYFDTIMQNGIMNYSDTINVHSHSTDSADGINYNGTLADMGKAYSAIYADNAPVWSTESGVRMPVTDADKELPSDESLRRQARYMITSFMETIGKYGVSKNFWFLTSHYVSEGPEYGTFSKNDMPYPAINSLNVLTGNLKDGKLLGRINGVADTEGYFFDCGEYDAAVIWTTNGSKNLQLHTDGNVSIVELVGNSDIKVYSPATGRVSFNVSEDPVLVKLSGKASCEDYVKTAFEARLPVSKTYSNTAERIVLQQIWDPKPDISNGAYLINSNIQYPVKCRIYNFNNDSVSGSFGFNNSEGIVISGENSGTFTVEANSYVEKEITIEGTAGSGTFSFQNLEFYAQIQGGSEIASSISQMRVQSELNTNGVDITVIPEANEYSNSKHGDYYSCQVSPSISNSWLVGNSVTYTARNLKNSDAPAQLYIYQANLNVNADSEGMYFKFTCGTFPSSFEKAYFDVRVYGEEGSFNANNLFEFNGSTKNKDIFIPWSAFVHSNGNVGITDPSKISKFGFGFDLSSSTAYNMAFTISDMGTYKSKSTEVENKDINISGIVDGGEYRQSDAKTEITTYDAENTEVYVNYEKVECVADENGVFELDFAEYEPGDYNLIVSVSDRFNKKNYKQVKFTVMKDYVYWK